MSLSKYYKNSESFQPEKIVKQEDSKNAGRENSFIRQQTSSQITSPPINGSSEKSPQTAKNLELAENEDGIVTDASRLSKVSESHDQVPDREIDLSNYIETTLAEKRIEDAYQKGLADGNKKAEDDYGTAVRALLSSCQQIDTVRETLIINNRKEVLDFSLAIAERILRISVQEQDSTVIATIEEALQRAVKSDEFTIYVHPDDYETIMAKTDELVTGLSGLNNIVVKKDITIDQGGTKIESANCTIDATIGSQYEVIKKELKGKT